MSNRRDEVGAWVCVIVGRQPQGFSVAGLLLWHGLLRDRSARRPRPYEEGRGAVCAIAFRHFAYVVCGARLRGLQRARKPRPYEGGTTAAGVWGRSS